MIVKTLPVQENVKYLCKGNTNSYDCMNRRRNFLLDLDRFSHLNSTSLDDYRRQIKKKLLLLFTMIILKSILLSYSISILLISVLIHIDLDKNSSLMDYRKVSELDGQLKYHYSSRGRIAYICNIGNDIPRSDNSILVFIPGFTSTMKTFAPLLKEIKSNYILLDFLGHGASDMPSDGLVSVPSMSSDLTSLLNHLFNSTIPSITLVGHSQGGSLASHYTLANAFVNRLVLLTPGGVDLKPRDFYENMLHLPIRAIHNLGVYDPTQRLAVASCVSLVKFANFFYKIDSLRMVIKSAATLLFSNSILFEDYFLLLEDWIFHFERLAGNSTYIDMVMSMMNNLDLLRDRTGLYSELGRIHLHPSVGIHRARIKVDLVLGNNDAVVTIKQGKRLAEKIDGVNLFVLPGGHLLPLEQPAEIARILVE